MSQSSWRRPGVLLATVAVALSAYSAVSVASRPPTIVAAPTAVGIVDLERLIGSLAEVKAQQTQMDNRGKELQLQVEEIKKAFETAKSEYDVAAANDPKKLEKRFRAEELAVRFESHKQGLTKVMAVERGQYIRSLYARITESVEKLAKQQGLQLVTLDDRSFKVPAEAGLTDTQLNQVIQNKKVLFAENSVDITDQLAQLMNNEFSAAGGKK